MSPLLQELDIYGIPLEWETGEFRNLHVLKIGTNDNCNPFLSEFITLLRTLPKLEEFGFDGNLRPPEENRNPSFPSHHPITLPHLKHLYIQTEKLSGEITLGGGLLWDEDPLHLPDALTRAVGHFIPVIRSKLVPGERVIIVADEALNCLHTPNVKLSVAANIRSSCPATQVPHWMIDNICSPSQGELTHEPYKYRQHHNNIHLLAH
ncbi:hypothetical protein M407DRAFT_34834 [Tulasnella calospora MUT 4182]|uniref:Uncharacterized protein n=1 Tax=Tulasnella calospora MUT 4182 TaxID=1051891 RepID=A0A0C3Q0P3_9AGAM|nr:hypothetical protein M407DRAFT_34834 [Tulasnella calospora MUT 4182]